MNKAAVLTIAALVSLPSNPSFSQNYLARELDASKPFVLVGSLNESAGVIADDAVVPYAIISLYDPVDLFCSAAAAPACAAAQEISEFRLNIPEPLQWAYRENIDTVVSLGATVADTPPIDGILTLDVIDLAPISVSTSLTPGRYVMDKRYCQKSVDEYSDDFGEFIVSGNGALQFNSWETGCDAVALQSSGKRETVTWGCFSEGYAYTEQTSLSPLSADAFQFERADAGGGQFSLCSFEDQFPDTGSAPDLLVDLRGPHADEIPYGSRIGMNAAIAKLSGVDGANAELIAKIMPDNAYEFCGQYAGKLESECIKNELSLEISEHISADCNSGNFTNIYGRKRKLIGLSAPGSSTDFLIIGLESGETLDASSASGYYTDLEMFETLCPSTIAKLLDRPKARSKLSVETYPSAFEELQYWQGRAIGSNGPGQRELADLSIWQFATRMRPEPAERVLDLLGSTKLTMAGHFGFAASAAGDRASLLVDFSRQEIYICALIQQSGRAVSYRFGTPLKRGLDGFGSACPSTFGAALDEYLPLVGPEQQLAFLIGDSWDHEVYFQTPYIEEDTDFLGMGGVFAGNECPRKEVENFDTNHWWYRSGGNWMWDGVAMEYVGCRIDYSAYSPTEDSISIYAMCAGHGSSYSLFDLVATRVQGAQRDQYLWDGRRIQQCSPDPLISASGMPVRGRAVLETIYNRNGMQSWADVSSGAIYQVGEYSFSFFTASGAEDSEQVLNVAVSLSGTSTASINLPTAFGGNGAFGIYQMGEAATPTLVVASFGGGAHCCTEYAFLPLTPEPSEVSFAGSFDGDYWYLWDIDRDGNFELARPDIRFPEAMGPHLDLWAPPIIYAMQDGIIADATSAARYQPYLREKMAVASQQCGTTGGWAVGACQGWAATALRLGEYDATMATIAKRFAAAPKNTTMGDATFATFLEELEGLFAGLGYQKAPILAEQPVVTTSAFDGLTCSFRITRRVVGSGNSGELAQGTFDIEQDRAINMKGSWTTVGPVIGDAFAGAELSFGTDGGLRGELAVYPLFAQTEMEIPPSFTVSLDGTSTTSVDGGPEGATKFLVDFDKIEIIATVSNCR